MAVLKGRGIQVQVAATMGTAKTVTAVTLANPGVATSTAHGLTNDTVGVWSAVTGMLQLEGQATRVKNTAANAFDLQGLNTTNYSAFTAGTFTPVATWATLAECDQYDIGGGSADKLDTTCLIDIVKQEENGFLATQSITLNLKATDTPSAALALIEAAAQAGNRLVFRVILQGGAVRVFNAEPSLSGESVQAGAVGTGSISLAVKGFALKLAA